ncbi:hypothetical protein ACFPRL_03315 [Pseudoclavibacter helvolus]
MPTRGPYRRSGRQAPPPPQAGALAPRSPLRRAKQATKAPRGRGTASAPAAPPQPGRQLQPSTHGRRRHAAR